MKTKLISPLIHRHSCVAFALALAGWSGLAEHSLAQSTWLPASGDWHTAAQWDNGVPTSSTVARFWLSDASPDHEVSITIGAGTAKAAVARTLQVWSGKEVNLHMTEGSSLSAVTELWRIGYDFNIPNEAASLTITGPVSGTATVTAGQIMVGAAPGSDPVGSPAGGHRLTFSGAGLSVLQSGTTASVVGRFGSNNVLEVLNGAKVTRAGINISDANVGAGKSDNRVAINGAGSQLAITGTLNIGAGLETRSNRVSVGNAGFSNVSERAALHVNVLNVGGTSIDNLGGNQLHVQAGGYVKTQGVSTVRAHAANGGNNDGANRIVIENQGMFSAGADLSVYGLLKLEAGGVLEGRGFLSDEPLAVSLNIESDGRFEAAGSGLAGSVTTNIRGGTMALGSGAAEGGRSSGALLELDSAIHFDAAEAGRLELSWFGENSYDQIHFDTGGLLSGDEVRLVLMVVPGVEVAAGTEWTLFTGDVLPGITASFDLSLIDANLWSTDYFNSAGGWRIVAIPEPGTWLLLSGGLLTLVAYRRRK